MKHLKTILAVAMGLVVVAGCKTAPKSGPANLTLNSGQLADGKNGALKLDGFFYETAQGRFEVRGAPLDIVGRKSASTGQGLMADGRNVEIVVTAEADVFKVQMRASPADGITRWGFAVEAKRDESFTGLMERTVDGPQQASWTLGVKAGMNLRGQKVDMILKPTTSVYAPFFLSSRGYGLFVKTDWPGKYDFCATDSKRVKVEFEGPMLAFKVYTATNPVALVEAHARDAGLPILPPKAAMSVPERPIATPTSAAASEGPSLMPSPTMSVR